MSLKDWIRGQLEETKREADKIQQRMDADPIYKKHVEDTVKKANEEWKREHERYIKTDEYKGTHDPVWAYTHWSWTAISNDLKAGYANEWRNSHSHSYSVLYKLLLSDEYGSEWYYINNVLSYNSEIPTLPDPDNDLVKQENGMLRDFYEVKVPFAGAFVKWYQQMNVNLVSPSDRAEFYVRMNTRAPGKWFSLTSKKLTTAAEDIFQKTEDKLDNFTNKAGNKFVMGSGLFLAGVVGIGLIALSSGR
jgi:hypothetical protein